MHTSGRTMTLPGGLRARATAAAPLAAPPPPALPAPPHSSRPSGGMDASRWRPSGTPAAGHQRDAAAARAGRPETMRAQCRESCDGLGWVPFTEAQAAAVLGCFIAASAYGGSVLGGWSASPNRCALGIRVVRSGTPFAIALGRCRGLPAPNPGAWLLTVRKSGIPVASRVRHRRLASAMAAVRTILEPETDGKRFLTCRKRRRAHSVWPAPCWPGCRTPGA